MAITVGTSSYLSAGPAKSGQILAPNTLSGLEVALVGAVTLTLDGSATSAVVNFIDGTQTVQFNSTNASAVPAFVVGGTQGAAAVVSVITDTITSTGFTVRLSGAGTSANTIKLVYFIMK